MQKIVSYFILLLLSSFLSGCYAKNGVEGDQAVTETTQEAAAPAYPIGQSFDQPLDETDNNKINRAMDNNPTNQTTLWKNEASKTKFVIAPTSNRRTINGNPECRRFYMTLSSDGVKLKRSGMACRDQNGVWMVVAAAK